MLIAKNDISRSLSGVSRMERKLHDFKNNLKICKDTIKAIHIEYCRKVLLLKRNECLQKLKCYLL